MSKSELINIMKENMANRKTAIVTIRVPKSVLNKLKSLLPNGRGYTSTASRIITDISNDDEKLKKYL